MPGATNQSSVSQQISHYNIQDEMPLTRMRHQRHVDPVVLVRASVQETNLTSPSLFGWRAVQNNLTGQAVASHTLGSSERRGDRGSRDEVVTAGVPNVLQAIYESRDQRKYLERGKHELVYLRQQNNRGWVCTHHTRH